MSENKFVCFSLSFLLYRNQFHIVKPIFHQNAKYLASGAGVGQCPRRQSVEYRWRWACTFQVVCVNFISVWKPRQTQFSVEYGLYGSSIGVQYKFSKLLTINDDT